MVGDMRLKKTLAFLAFILLLYSCEKEEPVFTPLKVGTFNIAWLGDGERDRIDREPEDYKLIADVIEASDMDVIGLQEIENGKALDILLNHLPEYEYVIGKTGRAQKLAVLFKDNIEIDLIGEYMPVAIEKNRNRPGLVVEGKKGNFDWLMMVVHFKSTSRWDNTPKKRRLSIATRKRQAELVNRWADSVLSEGDEKDIFIVGDFNDTPKRKKNNTLLSLKENKSFEFLTSEMKSCKYRGLYVIDHVVASESAMKRYQENSERLINLYAIYDKNVAKRVSDHCPVYAIFEVESPDND